MGRRPVFLALVAVSVSVGLACVTRSVDTRAIRAGEDLSWATCAKRISGARSSRG